MTKRETSMTRGVTPELALVDPELARRVRRRVPQKRLGHRPPLPVLRLPAVEAAHAVGAVSGRVAH